MRALLLLVVAGCGTGPDSSDTGDTDAADTQDVWDSEDPDDTGVEDTADVEDTGDPTDTGDATDTGDTQPPDDTAPVVYPADVVHSPLTPSVARRMAEIAAIDPTRSDDVFMKIGASSTVSRSTLHCFAGSDVDLGDHTDLQGALDHYLGGDAAGSTPFDRDTLAAQSGRHAGWAIAGDPSPVEAEIAAISPRLGIVHYGTNDMGMASSYAAALDVFFGNMTTLLDLLEGEGVVPLLTGISRRGDSVAADRWVDAWNAAIRGMAQDRQVPFIDLELATRHLDGYGLAGDGVHLEGYPGGACVLTDQGLEHGYNVRNLIVLQALDRVHRSLDLAQAAPDAGDPLAGDGSAARPWAIPSLPFAHVADTSTSPHDALDVYDGCGATQDESGPEWTYRLTLDEPTPLRLGVLDRGDTDVDLHLLDATGTTAGCVARAHRVVEGTLAAGTWTVVLDTFVDGAPRSGEYLLVVARCLDDDPACADPL